MILHAGILALIVGTSIVLAMVLYACWIGVRILRRWDAGSSSEEQLILERKTFLVSSIANMKTNNRNIDARVAGGKGVIGLSVEIADHRQMEKLIRSIGDLEGVFRVERRYRRRQASAS